MGSKLRIGLSGVLTMASLDASLDRFLFLPAARSKEDPYYMGWRHVESLDQCVVEIDSLKYATAEGTAALAAMVQCLRARPACTVEVRVAEKARAWESALELRQLVEDQWNDYLADEPARPAGCYVYPLRRSVLESRDKCLDIANAVSQRIYELLKSRSFSESEQIAFAVKTLFHEALLNVFEHAYARGQTTEVFSAVTISPAPTVKELMGSSFASQQEREWFESLSGKAMMLEVAVTDFGRGIPRTLWASYKKQNERAFEGMDSLRLAEHIDKTRRLRLHHEIASWALTHGSTCKSSKTLSDKLALYGWRGLHRVANIAGRLNGAIVLRTGLARTGYVFMSNGNRFLEPMTSTWQREFPGTALVFRLPIWAKSHARVEYARRAPQITIPSPILPDKLVPMSDDLSSNIENVHSPHPRIIGICHPFAAYKGNAIEKALIDSSQSTSPQDINLHLLMYRSSEISSYPFLGFKDNTEPQGIGVPRLMAIWSPTRPQLAWRFAGLVPLNIQSILQAIERNGIATIGSDPALRRFAEELSTLYSPYITWDGSCLQLVPFLEDLNRGVIADAIDVAFGPWLQQSGTSTWLFDLPNTYVRLSTGTLVKKYISAHNLLYTHGYLSEIIGQRLALLTLRPATFPKDGRRMRARARRFYCQYALRRAADSKAPREWEKSAHHCLSPSKNHVRQFRVRWWHMQISAPVYLHSFWPAANHSPD